MNTITLQSKQTTDKFYNYIKKMVVKTLEDAEYFNEAYEVTKINVIRNKGFYLVQFEAKGQKFEVEYTIDQIQSFVIEELEVEIKRAAMSTGYSGR